MFTKTIELQELIDKHINVLNKELSTFNEELIMKKYTVTVTALVSGIFFNRRKKISQIIETYDIEEELVQFGSTINDLYSNKIIIEDIEYRELV